MAVEILSRERVVPSETYFAPFVCCCVPITMHPHCPAFINSFLPPLTYIQTSPIAARCPHQQSPLSKSQHRRATVVSTILTRPPTSLPLAIESHDVPNHPAWRYAGPPLTVGPTPAVIYFALTASQSLELDPFNQFVTSLLPTPETASLRVFSVTLPFHADMAANEAAFEQWADTYRAGGDLITSFIRKVSTTVDSFIQSGYLQKDAIYAAGLSRGGLMAAHLTAQHHAIKACLAFAPVTVLADLPEFSEAAIPADRARQKVHRASLLNDHIVERLAEKPVRFYMGNFDRRVGTRNAFELTHLLAERAASRGVRSPPHEFVMYCSVGKQGHGTPSDVFKAGADYILSLLQGQKEV